MAERPSSKAAQRPRSEPKASGGGPPQGQGGSAPAPIRVDAEVVENRQEGGANHRLVLRVPGWPGFEPGQFVMLSPGPRTAAPRSDPLLPRPMAVYRARGVDEVHLDRGGGEDAGPHHPKPSGSAEDTTSRLHVEGTASGHLDDLAELEDLPVEVGASGELPNTIVCVPGPRQI